MIVRRPRTIVKGSKCCSPAVSMEGKTDGVSRIVESAPKSPRGFSPFSGQVRYKTKEAKWTWLSRCFLDWTSLQTVMN